jgi:hypothetical protein
MAEEIRQPDPPNYGYGLYKNVPGTGGLPAFPDTFVGPYDKAYADFLARDMTRIRGVNCFYYVKEDMSLRIDGDHPLSNKPEAIGNPLARKRHAGMALYGEQVIVGEALDSVRHKVQPDWPYKDPILVRGVPYDLEYEHEPDERGAIHIRRMRFDLARVLCEKEWDFEPQPGDVLRFTEKLHGYYDVERIEDYETRFGTTGNLIAYKMALHRTTRYEPQRKIAERKLTSDEEILDEQTNEPSQE